MDGGEIQKNFRAAPFVADIGMELESVNKGICVTRLPVSQRHLQQNGFVHAGVQFTMADHTSGAAASSLVATGCYVVTAEIKVSYLKAAKGELLICKAKVLKPGRNLFFVEAEVFCRSADGEDLVAKASTTMAVVTP